MKLTLGFGIRTLLCVAIAGAFLYLYMNEQNNLTALRLAIPVAMKDLKKLQEENVRLRYEIDQFENPSHLMELARQPQFAHLKHPYSKDVLYLHSPNAEKNDQIRQP